MDISQIRTFLEVVSTGSFVAAAERLNVTQSTVSVRIRTLEEQVGCTLFIRNKAGATLTPAGQRFQLHAAQLLRIWEQARQDVAVPSGYEAVLRIGGEAGLWNRLLNRWVPWMRQHHSEIALRCELGLAEGLTLSIVEGQLDIGVMYTPQSRPGLRIEQFVEEELVFVSAPPLEPGAPMDYVYVDWGREFGLQHRRSFPEFSSPPLVVGLGTLGFQYIVENGGQGYFPRRLADPFIKSGRLRLHEQAPRFHLPIFLVYSTGLDRGMLDAAVRGLEAIIEQPARLPDATVAKQA